MSEENKQDLKEKEIKTDETLNLTGKELEEYKTYLKFKNEIQKQNESQDNVQEASESFDKEVGTTHTDTAYYYNQSKETRLIQEYKEQFMKPLDAKSIEDHVDSIGSGLLGRILLTPAIFYLTRDFNGLSWIIFKIAVGLMIAVSLIQMSIMLFSRKTVDVTEPKLSEYNQILGNNKWLKVQKDDIAFNKYYKIAEETIKNKLHLSYKKLKIVSNEYAEVYKISNSNMYVVFGVYSSYKFLTSKYVPYMVVINNDKYFLNIVDYMVMNEKIIRSKNKKNKKDGVIK